MEAICKVESVYRTRMYDMGLNCHCRKADMVPWKRRVGSW